MLKLFQQKCTLIIHFEYFFIIYLLTVDIYIQCKVHLMLLNFMPNSLNVVVKGG